MICDKCGKEINVFGARHCSDCGRDYCPECACGVCGCASKLGYYS